MEKSATESNPQHDSPQADQSKVSAHPLLLPALMVGGATLGFVIGSVFAGRWGDPGFIWARGFFKLIGDILMNSLKMLVVPLIVCSVIHAVASIGDIRKAGRLFFVTICYFVITMMMAVCIGLALVNTIKPGVGASTEIKSDAGKARAEKAKTHKGSPIEKIYDVVRSMFPANMFKAALDGDVLGLILISIIFGGILGTMGSRGYQVANLFAIFNDALMTFVHLAIWFAPVGIMGLVAERIGTLGGMAAVGDELSKLFWYALTVVLGLLIHGLIVLPTLLFVLGRRNPWRYMAGMFEALVCAFSTASSAATLPLTLKCLQNNNGISKRTVGFVVPLGATVNMNGTALYEAVAAIFIAQAYGVHLDFTGQLLILITATLAAIGAAAIPEAGLVTMVIVLVAVDLPVEGVGLILAIDWILDRCRTTVNVWDDCVAAGVVEHWLTNDQFGSAPAHAVEAESSGN